LVSDLKQLGVRENSVLLVHSSLRSLGNFPDRAELAVEALTLSVGKYGTLLMPALSYETVNKNNPYFNVRETPSCVGALTEFFRTRSGVIRSVMPTHSICGIGYQAYELLNEHHMDSTPCGEHSPFRKLRNAGGQILFIGCGLRPNTSMHAIEELVEPPYLFGDYINYEITLMDGDRTIMKLRRHDFNGYEQRYDRAEYVLDSQHLRKGKVLNASCHLLEASALWERAHEKLLEDPLFFVDKKNY
jgi:aminoglycoside 3-N-acetyltransferase